MKVHGRTSISEFLGDFLVYRNLNPVDARLPEFPVLQAAVGLGRGSIPRKSNPEYGRVIVEILNRICALDQTKRNIQKVIYLGSVEQLDVAACKHICAAGQYNGIAFICNETSDTPRLELREEDSVTIVTANKWSLLSEFDALCRSRGFNATGETALITEIDTTVIGARGRNDAVIAQVRLEAAFRIIKENMSQYFNRTAFQQAYETLNQPLFHPFTEDNQDYLVYLCLAIGSGVVQLDALVEQVQSGKLTTFAQFLHNVEQRVASLPADMQFIHNKFFDSFAEGDPTPFKLFRMNEYKQTIERMGCCADTLSAEEILRQEIVITEEVRDFIFTHKLQGMLVFGISDKPDEASLPTNDLAVRGFQPVHQTITHSIGE